MLKQHENITNIIKVLIKVANNSFSLLTCQHIYASNGDIAVIPYHVIIYLDGLNPLIPIEYI